MIWILMIPLMILGFAIATVPIIVAMWKEEKERRAAFGLFSDRVGRELAELDTDTGASEFPARARRAG